MASYKLVSMLVVLLVVLAIGVQYSEAFVDACNEVCSRTKPEWDECCRAHGYPKGAVDCRYHGRMNCWT
ncbi:spodomicin-like [Leguminivora glycinivorella]|uniref:spodomicin-like n=1 Tax=Leguminivora glycinivorella TaxID=1035111 RepID=UPI00200C9543|nr:spodomicin-like [Leguminivora glycinivorella]